MISSNAVRRSCSGTDGVLRRDHIAVALLASAFANLALLIIAMHSPDFRYAHWLIVASLVGLALRLGQVRRA